VSLIKASIDIGSNSILLLVGEITGYGIKEIVKKSSITSLGKGLDKTQMFSEESMHLTEQVLKDFISESMSYGVSSANIVITATEASRVAKNAREFFAKIESYLGVKIHIISPKAEAYFSTKGIVFNSKFESEVITIMDIGGASTELIKFDTKKLQILDSVSMPLGSVRVTEWIQDDLFVQNLQKIFVDYRVKLDSFQTRNMICVAGTMTSLGNMHLKRKDFVEDEVNGLSLTNEDIDILFKQYSGFAQEEFLNLFPFLGKRSFSILGGLHLVYHLTHRLFVKDLVVSTYGLRYGTILEGNILKDHLYGE